MQGMYPSPLDQGMIYVKFDDPSAGNSKENCNLPGELKEYASINLCPKCFHGRSSNTVTITRMEFPLVLGHVMTVHKSREFGFDNMLCDLNRTSKT